MAAARLTAMAPGPITSRSFCTLLTEVDPEIHLQMERGHVTHFTNSDRFAKVWFVNGRVFPDLFQGDYNPLFPHQPYQSLAQAHPGEKVLVRQVNAGQDSHPFHFHGENLRFIGRDGRKLSSDGVVADLGRSDNTINSAPKQAIDAIWEWTGKNLGWDIYGHDTAHVCDMPILTVSAMRPRPTHGRVVRRPRQGFPGDPAGCRGTVPGRLVERQPVPG